jgi:hypothetical protein
MKPSRPLPFTQFVAKVLNVRLADGQRVLCLVAYDGLEPRDLSGPDREIARDIFGDVDVIPREARRVLVAVCGARAGKSYILCALRLLHLALTVPLTTLAPGEIAAALVVAPRMELARQCLRYASGAAREVPNIAKLITSETEDGFVLHRDGKQVTVRALPASSAGTSLRGRSLVGAVLDEAAFFRDEDYAVNDTEVFKAVAPRVMPGGQVIIASTPWARGIGLLYDLFSRNHGTPKRAIAAHAPTLLLRKGSAGEAEIRMQVEATRESDPDNAAREFDAQFMTAGTGLFFDPSAIDAAVDGTALLPLQHLASSVTCAGADFAFRSDASALVVARLEGDICRVAELLEMRPEKDKPLVPSVVVAAFAETIRPYQCTSVYADRHCEEAIREHLATHKLRLVPGPDGLAGKVETYTRVRALLHEGKIRLPPDRKLINQLKAVTSKPTSGGSLSISSPRRDGAHGDIVSAFVLAVASLPTGAPNDRMQRVLTDDALLFDATELAA